MIDTFRMLGKIETYEAPHVLIKRGQSKKQFCASFIDFDCCFKHAIYGVTFNKGEISLSDFSKKENLLKSLTVFLNSKFASYYLFLTTMSWGVEREEVSPNEMLSLPGIPFETDDITNKKIIEKFNDISFELKRDFISDYKVELIESEINSILFNALGISQRERYLIEDVLDYSLDLFQEGENSIAIKPVDQHNSELHNYLDILCEDINEHLQFANESVWASIWEMPASNPMRLVAIHFTKERSKGDIYTFPHSSELNSIIRSIDKYSYEKHSASVYFRKVVRYYEGDIVYIIKPNQKRFWSRSQAMQDSKTILLEIANMSEE